MKSLILFLATSICLAMPMQAQYVNTVKLGLTSFYIRDRQTDYNPTGQAGISYQRKVYKNFHVGLCYQQWTNWSKGSEKRLYGHEIKEPAYSSFLDGSMAQELMEQNRQNYIGDIYNDRLLLRQGYKMVDLSAIYKASLGAKHNLAPGIGLSYCAGGGEYVKGFYVNPMYGIARPTIERKVDKFFGIIPQLSYDYLLLKGTACIVVDLRARYYKGWQQAQYDYGVHVGINF